MSIFKTKNVWEGNKSIVLNKFLKGLAYTAALAAITFIIDVFMTGNIPQEWVIYTGVVIALAQTAKKALERYDPTKDR